MDVGFIGLGHMGEAMARNLLKAGHRVVAYNRTRGKAEALNKDGAEVADRPADACRGEAVITMLADDAAVEAVVFGPDGGLAGVPELRLSLTLPSQKIGPIDAKVTDLGGYWGSGSLTVPVAGTWTVKATVRVSDLDQVTVSKPVRIAR